ncbi:unnamed protein product [Ambrosiozyma monospora]|uniref:Unnamed protein product n=1 Tax=Ambrosiozyma monospora TaxID=43982 RepID=A0ACB5SVN7_AMBMO|nr:unnamed protein product [Ambrosiozyma monospora]
MSTMEKYNKSRDHKFTLDSNGLLTVSNLNDLNYSIDRDRNIDRARDRDFSSKPTSIYTSASPNGHRHSPQRKLKPIDAEFKSKSHVSPPLPPLRPAPVLSAAVMDSNKSRKNLNKINLKTINTITNSRNGKNTPPSSQPPPVPPFPASLAAKSRSKALASLAASASQSNSSSSSRKSPSPGSSRSASNANPNSLSKASSLSRSRSTSTSTSTSVNNNGLRSLTLSPSSPEKNKKLGNLTQKLRSFHSPKRSQQSNSQHSTPRVISSPMLVQTSFPLASIPKYSPPRNVNNNGTFGDYLISPKQSTNSNNNNSHDTSINSNSNSSSLTSSFGITSGNTSLNTTPRSSNNKSKSRNTSINSMDSMNSGSSSVYNGESSKLSSHKTHNIYGFNSNNSNNNSNNSLTGKHSDVLYPNSSRTVSTSHSGSKSTLHSNKSEETFVSNGSKSSRSLSTESRKSRSQSKSPIFRSPSSEFKGRSHFNSDFKSTLSSSTNSGSSIVANHNRGHSHQQHRPNHRSHTNSGRRERAAIDAASSFCSVCGLPLSDTISYKEFGNGEQILELSCHHYVHEECLLLKMGFVPPERDKTSSASYFPDCAKCADGTIAIPCDDRVSDEIVTKFLSDPRYSIGDDLTSDLMLASPNNGSDLSSPSIQTRRQQLGQLSDASLLSIAPPPRDTFKRHHKKQSRGSSVSAISSIISSVSETSPVMNSYPMPTIYTSIGSAWNSNFSLELLRAKFVDELCKLSQQGHVTNVNSSSENDDQGDNEEKLKLSKSLIESFGSLRLFDKMKLSHDGL